MRLRDRLGLSEAWQRRLTWAMELSLVGMLFVGLDRGNTGIVVNAAVALAVTRLPAVLERDYDIALDAGLTLWITAAVWLHVLGTVGVPGAGQSFYSSVPGYDHLTHVLSSSIVAAVGYTTVRAFENHTDEVHIPPRYTFVFVVLFVLAFGVLWEVIEFALGEVSRQFGTGAVLTQYGLRDTMLDLVFDAVGAVIVAVWGTAHLTDVVGHASRYLDERRRA